MKKKIGKIIIIFIVITLLIGSIFLIYKFYQLKQLQKMNYKEMIKQDIKNSNAKKSITIIKMKK